MTPTLQLALAAGGLLGVAALGACVAQRARSPRPQTGGEATASPIASASTTEDLPPLDLAARHVRYQTATFALG